MYQALNPNKHKSLKLNPLKDYKFAKQEAIVPVGLGELEVLAAEMPIVFGSNENPGLFALCSLQRNSNHLISESGEWQGETIPQALKNYPFSLQALGAEGRYAVVFDEQTPMLSKSRGKMLYRKNSTS